MSKKNICTSILILTTLALINTNILTSNEETNADKSAYFQAAVDQGVIEGNTDGKSTSVKAGAVCKSLANHLIYVENHHRIADEYDSIIFECFDESTGVSKLVNCGVTTGSKLDINSADKVIISVSGASGPVFLFQKTEHLLQATIDSLLIILALYGIKDPAGETNPNKLDVEPDELFASFLIFFKLVKSTLNSALDTFLDLFPAIFNNLSSDFRLPSYTFNRVNRSRLTTSPILNIPYGLTFEPIGIFHEIDAPIYLGAPCKVHHHVPPQCNHVGEKISRENVDDKPRANMTTPDKTASTYVKKTINTLKKKLKSHSSQQSIALALYHLASSIQYTVSTAEMILGLGAEPSSFSKNDTNFLALFKKLACVFNFSMADESERDKNRLKALNQTQAVPLGLNIHSFLLLYQLLNEIKSSTGPLGEDIKKLVKSTPDLGTDVPFLDNSFWDSYDGWNVPFTVGRRSPFQNSGWFVSLSTYDVNVTVERESSSIIRIDPIGSNMYKILLTCTIPKTLTDIQPKTFEYTIMTQKNSQIFADDFYQVDGGSFTLESTKVSFSGLAYIDLNSCAALVPRRFIYPQNDIQLMIEVAGGKWKLRSELAYVFATQHPVTSKSNMIGDSSFVDQGALVFVGEEDVVKYNNWSVVLGAPFYLGNFMLRKDDVMKIQLDLGTGLIKVGQRSRIDYELNLLHIPRNTEIIFALEKIIDEDDRLNLKALHQKDGSYKQFKKIIIQGPSTVRLCSYKIDFNASVDGFLDGSAYLQRRFNLSRQGESHRRGFSPSPRDSMHQTKSQFQISFTDCKTFLDMGKKTILCRPYRNQATIIVKVVDPDGEEESREMVSVHQVRSTVLISALGDVYDIKHEKTLFNLFANYTFK